MESIRFYMSLTKAPFMARSLGMVSAVLLFVLIYPSPSQGQFVFSGFPLMNRKFQILVSPYGYSDSLLDRRYGFKGREYLSGEWAAAVYYQGGHLSAATRWLTPMFVFPDFLTMGPNYGVELGFHIPNPLIPTNIYGFTNYQSIITNGDLRITISYEMIDLGTNASLQLPIGLVAKSVGGAGSYLFSGRYVFKQTYKLANISGNTLNNVRFSQFLHTLEGTWGVYDDRSYGGGMPDYHHTVTLQGTSRSFNSKTLETVEHIDTVAFSARMAPWSYEMGLFGAADGNDHQTGKPTNGVHLSVEANSLNGSDSIYTNKDAWVSGAMCFQIGTLTPNSIASVDLLLSVHTTSTVVYPPVNLVIRRSQMTSSNVILIDFQEMSNHPELGFALFKSTNPVTPLAQWDYVPVGYQINAPMPGWNRFRAPINPMDRQNYYRVQGVLIE